VRFWGKSSFDEPLRLGNASGEYVSIDVFIVGRGLVVGAREHWRAIQTTSDVSYVDNMDVASIRKTYPEWAGVSLSPVAIVDSVGDLICVESISVDYLIDWSLSPTSEDVDRIFSATKRVLRPGGTLLIPSLSSSGLKRSSKAVSWSQDFGKFTAQILRLDKKSSNALSLQALFRLGGFNVAAFRKPSELISPLVVSCDPHVYLLEGVCLRRISSIESFERLRSSGIQLVNISEIERSLFVEGRVLHGGEVEEIISKWGVGK
jgi:hypothetical protein